MRYALALALLVPLALAAVSGPATAQVPAQEQDIYAALYETMTADPQGLGPRSASAATAALIVAGDTNVAGLAGLEPGLEQALAEAMLPTFAAHMNRVQNLYRPRYIALFAAELTPARAAEIDRIMGSPQGQRVLRRARENAMTGITSDRMTSGDPLTDAETRGLIDAQRRAVLSDTDRADQLAFRDMALENPAAFADLERLQDLMVPLRTQMDNEPLLPAHEAQMTAALEKVFATLFP